MQLPELNQIAVYPEARAGTTFPVLPLARNAPAEAAPGRTGTPPVAVVNEPYDNPGLELTEDQELVALQDRTNFCFIS